MLTSFKDVGTNTAYLIYSLPLALAAFIVSVAGTSMGIGTLVIVVGIFVIIGVHHVCRWLAELELKSTRRILKRGEIAPFIQPAPGDATTLRRLLHPLTQGQSWLNVLWAFAYLPIALFTGLFAVSWWFLTFSSLTYPIYGWFIPDVEPTQAPIWLGVTDNLVASMALNFVVGIAAFFALPWGIKGLAFVNAKFSEILLATFGTMQERLEHLSESRDAATSAESIGLRRLERDIHDGPQQRLVHLGMELSRVKRSMKRDPEGAQKALDGAIAQTRETLQELRALSQGIAPPILTDRGLNAALSALAARSSVPVNVDLNGDERFDAKVENTIYFVAAEALTNIAKHSQATDATMELKKLDGKLAITIGDNGAGGAHPSKGRGLYGLTERVRSADGELAIDSPEGGPTVISAEVPCE